MNERGIAASRGSVPVAMAREAQGAPADESTPAHADGIGAEQVAAIADYLGVNGEALERLQSLRDQVQELLRDEFNVVAADLIQLRRLLSDAAEKLSGTFQVVTASSAHLRTTVARMRDGSDPAGLGRIGELAAEIASTTGTTIQSLQFEDMATQLLQHVDRKLAILARLSRDLAVINPTGAGVSPHLREEQLDALFAKFEAYRAELATVARKVVQQESLASGDIELF